MGRTPGPLLAASVVTLDVSAVYKAECTCVKKKNKNMEVSISGMRVLFYSSVPLDFLKNAFKIGVGRNGGIR